VENNVDSNLNRIWISKYPKGTHSEIEMSKYRNIVQAMKESCEKFGGKPSFTNLGFSLSFSDLDQLSDDFASFLQNELKLKKGDRVAVQLPNVLQFPIAVFGILKAGLIVVNTNPLYTATEMSHQFKDSGAKAILILANFAHLLESVINHTQIESVIVTELADVLPWPKRGLINGVVKHIKKMVPPYNLPHKYSFRQALQLGAMKTLRIPEMNQKDIAFLQYTGGTTGTSKGAVLTHQNVLANMLQICEAMRPIVSEGVEVIVTALPMYHIFSLTVNCLTFMKYGAENLLITNPRDISGFIADLKKHHFTILTGVNTLFNALMNHPEFKEIDFKTLKISVAGAMSLQSSVARRWQEMTGTKVIEGYGLTEAAPVVCVNPTDGSDQLGTIGIPVASTDIKLVDDEGREVKQGDPGELCCKGPQVMEGYWQRPEETENVLKDGWLHTGDIAVMGEDGFFKIVDRKKDMILVSGFNVYPNEVEDAIATHPGVLEVAAVGIPSESSGEVVKVVIVKKESDLSAEMVIEHARKTLTNYKVPKVVEFRTELPKTNVGKILRRALRDST